MEAPDERRTVCRATRVKMAPTRRAVRSPVDVWTRRLPDGDPDRRARGREDLLSEVVRSYGLGSARLDRRCRLCGHSDHGKPRLVDSAEFDLSIAHAGAALVVAVGRGSTVGVDVETTDRLRFDLRSAGGVFSASESVLLAQAKDWRLLSLALWTRKEAVVKATGWGLVYPLDQVTVAGPGTAVFDGDVFELEVEEGAFGVATYVLRDGEVLSIAAASPWPGVRWCGVTESPTARSGSSGPEGRRCPLPQ